ncbi:MAG: hypothetical protein IJ737_04645 [Ruminococcus sp.]|nr:hypothetical protein [Ruminococcus sp.]
MNEERQITSDNFDYDLYSGGSAKELMDEYERFQKEEELKAKKEEAELRRAQYEEKFKGMSADELFGMPSAEPPENTYQSRPRTAQQTYSQQQTYAQPNTSQQSYTQQTAAQQNTAHQGTAQQNTAAQQPQGGYQRRYSKEQYEQYSSRQFSSADEAEEKRAQAMAAFYSMTASRQRQLDEEKEYYKNRGVYSPGLGYRPRTGGWSLGNSHQFYRHRYSSELEKSIYTFFIGFPVAAILVRFMFLPEYAFPFLIGFCGLIATFIRRMGFEKDSLSEAISNSKVQIGAFIVGVLLTIFMAF